MERRKKEKEVERGRRCYVPGRELVRAGKRDDAGYAGEWIRRMGETQRNDVLLFGPRGYYEARTLLTSIATSFRVSAWF